MPRNIYIYAPINIRKRSLRSVFSPTNSISSSVSTSSKYAPSTILNRSLVSRGYYDYSPSYSSSSYEDYAPLRYVSQSYKIRYAPSFDNENYYRYAPVINDFLSYTPSLISRFKPQPVIITNSDTLDSYFRFLVQLLRVLR